MKINKSSWHYKTYSFACWDEPPPVTNLCQYLRAIVFKTPLMGLLLSGICVLGAIVYASKIIFPPFVGYRVKGWSLDDVLGADVSDLVKYPGLPIGRFQVYPLHVLMAAALAFLGYLTCHQMSSHAMQQALTVVAIVVAGVGVIAGSIFLIFLYCTSDTSQVVSAYLDAKKKQICPLVEFTDDEPTSTDSGEST